MAFNRWLGDVPGVAQVTKVVPANPEVGDKFILTCNRKSITVVAASTSLYELISAFVTAITAAAASVPEWGEMTPSVGFPTGSTDATTASHLLLTGKSDGTPFTVTGSTSNVSVFNIVVQQIVAGTPSLKHRQRIKLPGPPTAGNFTVSLAGATTGNIAFNASAATVQTALNGLSTMGANGTTITKYGTGDWLVEFVDEGQPPRMIVNNVSLTGACSIVVSTTRQGIPNADLLAGWIQIYTLTIPSDTESFRLTFTGGSTYSGLAYYSSFIPCGGLGAKAEDVRTALESILVPAALASDTGGFTPGPATVPAFSNVDVEGPVGGPFIVRVLGTIDSTIDAGDTLDVDADTIVPDGGSVTIDLLSHAAAAGATEIQVITIIGGATGGTFALTFQGATTAGIAYNASAGTVQTALEALANIAPGDITVTLLTTLPYRSYQVVFGGAYNVTFSVANVLEMTGDATSLTGATGIVDVVQFYLPGRNEQQQVSVTDGVPTGGTYTLTFNAETTAGISYLATSATIQAAIEALATPVPGDILVTGGPLNERPFVVEFKGAYAKSDVALMTGSGASLTGSNTQTLTVLSNTIDPTGPFHADNANNWSLTHTPLATEDLYVTGDRSIKYGLTALAAIVPGSITIDAAFSGQIGLEYDNGEYIEYRQRKLQIGGAGTFKIFIGRGEGSGSKLIGLDLQTALATVVVERTGNPDTDRPAVLLLLNNSSADVNVSRGSVGIAFDTAETSSLGTLRESFVQTKDTDSFVVLGAGCTMPTVLKYGGAMEVNCPITTAFTQYGGDTDFNGVGTMTGLKVAGGTFNYKSSGALGGAPIVAGDGILSFDGDPRAKAVTNPIDVYGDSAEVVDTFKVVASLIIDYNFTTRQPGLGFDYRITRAATA